MSPSETGVPFIFAVIPSATPTSIIISAASSVMSYKVLFVHGNTGNSTLNVLEPSERVNTITSLRPLINANISFVKRATVDCNVDNETIELFNS